METQDRLMQFLDEDDFDKKYDILCRFTDGEISDLLIDNMAASLDFVINDGPVDVRFMELKSCLRTRKKYESLRLR